MKTLKLSFVIIAVLITSCTNNQKHDSQSEKQLKKELKDSIEQIFEEKIEAAESDEAKEMLEEEKKFALKEVKGHKKPKDKKQNKEKSLEEKAEKKADKLKDKLDLTSEQYQKIKSLYVEYETKKQVSKEQFSDNKDEKKLFEENLKSEYNSRISKILTIEQAAKFYEEKKDKASKD
jgi:Spy/CpxP family protein refolding chaperone